MSIVWKCDWCGEPIDNRATGDAFIRMEAEPSARAKDVMNWKPGWVAHYHVDDSGVSCWHEVRDAIRMIAEWGTELNAVPTVSDRKLERMRARHDAGMKVPIGKERWAIMEGPDGVYKLGVEDLVASKLAGGGLLTIASVREALEDASIVSIHGIGPKRIAEIRDALQRFDAKRETTA